MDNLKKLVRICLIILCSIGFIYQSQQLVLLYFSGRTIAEIRYEQQNQSPLPAITLRLPNLISIKNLIENFPEKSQQISRYDIQNDYSNFLDNQSLTIGQMLNEISWKELNITKFVVEGIDSSNENVIMNATPSQVVSLAYPGKCSTLLSTVDQQYNSLRIQVIKIELMVTFNLADTPPICNQAKSGQVDLVFHSAKNLANYESESLRVIQLKKYNLLRYSEVRTRLLPPPYDTNCKNYEPSYMRSDCIGQCMLKQLVSKCGHQCLGMSEISIVLRDEVLNEYHKMKACNSDESNPVYQCYYRNNDKVRNVCDKECRPDCEDVVYKYDIESVDANIDQNVLHLKVKHYFWGDQVVQYRPIISFIQLMSDLGGLMGMWLGLSMVFIIDYVMHLV